MALPAKALLVIQLVCFAVGMMFLSSSRYVGGYEGILPSSFEGWLFFILGWCFVVVSSVSAGLYYKNRRPAK